MRVSGEVWTDDQIAQLRKLWARGDSSSQIAATIGGMSRNAVRGKALRLHLQRRRRAPRKAAHMNGGTHPLGLRWTGPKAPAALPEPILAPDSDPVSFLLRTNRQCSYIAGDPKGPDTLCCGAKVERRGLCHYHLDLCWYKPVKQKRPAVFGLIGLQAKARAA